MIPSVPIIDCFQKIRQQVKCYLQMAGTMRKQELQEVCLIGGLLCENDCEAFSVHFNHFSRNICMFVG